MRLHPRAQVTQPVDQSYRYIPLTQNQVAIVDADDYLWLSQWPWCAQWLKRSKSFYAVRAVPKNGGGQILIAMQREIMKPEKGVLVDHRDHNTLNNQRSNLRLASLSQNQWNQRIPSDNTSGFKGVAFDKSRNKWIAYIAVHRKRISLGSFGSKEEAAERYRVAALEYHGEFACID